MNVQVINVTKKKSEPITITVDINKTVADLKKLIKTQCNISLPLSRMGVSYTIDGESKDKISMGEDNRQLLYYEKFSEKSVVYVKDIGPQFSYRLTYIIEYLGPLIIFPLLYYHLYVKTEGKVCTTQTICLFMSTFHYSKRIIESMFVHIFSRDTMPLFNLFKNCLYYWGFYGLFCGYMLFNESYYERQTLKIARYFFIAFFFSAELKNLKCHLILKECKVAGKGNKMIPNGEGFELVTCANYFWEIMSWFSFTIFSFHWAFALFTVAGYYQMREWAVKKHKDLLKKYGERYPKNRKIIIPYIY